MDLSGNDVYSIYIPENLMYLKTLDLSDSFNLDKITIPDELKNL